MITQPCINEVTPAEVILLTPPQINKDREHDKTRIMITINNDTDYSNNAHGRHYMHAYACRFLKTFA